MRAAFSSELIIKPFRSGIQLMNPAEARGHSLAAIQRLPFSCYFMNQDSRNVNVNEACAELCTTSSKSDLLGVDAHDLWDAESAGIIQTNDKQVMRTETLLITDDTATRKIDCSSLQMISFKLPWYDQNKLAGIFGMTLELNPQSLGDFTKNLTTIISAGLIKSAQLTNVLALTQPTANKTYLTKREMDILKLLVRNLTAKEIAARLFLSKRTVENYIDNIKDKTNCDSKYALIDKYYWQFNE